MIIGSMIQPLVLKRFDDTMEAYNKTSRDVNRKRVVGYSLVFLINNLHYVAFFGLCIYSVSISRFSMGTFLALSSLYNRVMGQLGFFSRLPMQWAHVSVSMDRIIGLLDMNIESAGFAAARNFKLTNGIPSDLSKCNDKVQLHIVDLDLPNNSKISISIKAGEFLGISGQTGAGKTTLALRVTGLLPANEQVALSGITDEDIMYIPAAGGICNVLSLRENISPSCSDAELCAILELVDMSKRWATTGLEFDDSLAQISTQFSSGEIQRLALGRALAKRPKLLVLDEAVSNIDLDGAEGIMHALSEGVLPRGIMVLISHREKDFAMCTDVLQI
jgi:ABC-type multidrug transport system fused ATPase/permease subunit